MEENLKQIEVHKSESNRGGGDNKQLAKRRKTQDKYLQVITDYKTGLSYSQVLKKHGIGPTTFSKIMKWFQCESLSINQSTALFIAIENKRDALYKIRKQIDKLEKMIEYFVIENIDKEGSKTFSVYNSLVALQKNERLLQNDLSELLGLYEYAKKHISKNSDCGVDALC